MARTPRSSVPKTSGQGISRLSYQKGRALSKSAAPAQVKGPGKIDLAAPRSYAKSGPVGSDPSGSMNVSYGDTFAPTDITDISGDNPKRPAKNPMQGLNLSGGVKGRKFPK